MPTIRILHASDLHISAQKDKNVSPIDQLTQLGKVKLNLTTLLHLASWAKRALKAFLKKMTAYWTLKWTRVNRLFPGKAGMISGTCI